MPDTPPAPIRGRTTQNCESSRVKLSACLASLIVALTLFWSLLSSTSETCPITTLRYLTSVLLAVRPLPVLNVTVMVGPSCIMLWTTREMPTSTATIGTIQTSETLKRRVLIGAWPGACGPSVALDFFPALPGGWDFFLLVIPH